MIDATFDINLGQLLALELRRISEFLGLACQIGMFGVGLLTDRHIFTCRHRHCPGHKTGDTGQQDVAWLGSGGSHADNETCSRDNTVIGAEHGRTEPPDAVDVVALGVDAQSAHEVHPS